MKWASAVFAQNAQSIVDQASSMAGITHKVPQEDAPTRASRQIHPARHVVWMSEDLLALPLICIGYAFMNEMAESSRRLPATEPRRGARAGESRPRRLRREGLPVMAASEGVLDAESSPDRRHSS